MASISALWQGKKLLQSLLNNARSFDFNTALSSAQITADEENEESNAMQVESLLGDGDISGDLTPSSANEKIAAGNNIDINKSQDSSSIWDAFNPNLIQGTANFGLLEQRRFDTNYETNLANSGNIEDSTLTWERPESTSINTGGLAGGITFTEDELNAIQGDEDKDDEHNRFYNFFKSVKDTVYELGLAGDTWLGSHQLVGNGHFIQRTDEEEAEYFNDIAILALYDNAAKEGEITMEDYKEVYDSFLEQYEDSLNKIVDKGWPTGVEGIINHDMQTVSRIIKNQDLMQTIDPKGMAESSARERLSNTAVSSVMDTLAESGNIKFMKANAQDFTNTAYNVADSIVSYWVEQMGPTFRVKQELVRKYGSEDYSKYNEEDRKLAEEVSRIESTFAGFVKNLGDYLSVLPKYADPNTGKLIVPDLVEGKTLQERMYDGIELGDLDYNYLIPKRLQSAGDVLSKMSSDLSYRNTLANKGFLHTVWETIQTVMRPIGPIIQEYGGQQILGHGSNLIYNNLSPESGRIGFNTIDQDMSIISTLNTNNSIAGAAIQQFNAKQSAYLPELASEVLATLLVTKGIDKIKDLKTINRITRTGAWKIISSMKKNGVKTTLEAIKNGTVGKGHWIDRAITNVVTKGGLDAVLDQVLIDAPLSSADSDFGSDTSAFFSVGGSLLGGIIPTLADAGTFRVIRNVLGGATDFKSAPNELGSAAKGTVWDLIDTLEYVEKSGKLNKDTLDRVANINFGVQDSSAVSIERLNSLRREFRAIDKAVRDTWDLLSDNQKQVLTNLTKEKWGNYIANTIRQVYGGDSQFAKRILMLINDSRTNPADVIKYALGINRNVRVGGWISQISLPGNTRRNVIGYSEDLDLIPSFQATGFGNKLKTGFSSEDIDTLRRSGYEWADMKNFQENNGKYYFTQEGLAAAGKDISVSSLAVDMAASTTKNAEDFDTLMKRMKNRKVSDETLTDIRQSGAYDVLADALSELKGLCGIPF